MEQKVVKLEIGKLLAVVIAIVVIALLAAMFLQSRYYQGLVTERRAMEQRDVATGMDRAADKFMIDMRKDAGKAQGVFIGEMMRITRGEIAREDLQFAIDLFQRDLERDLGFIGTMDAKRTFGDNMDRLMRGDDRNMLKSAEMK